MKYAIIAVTDSSERTARQLSVPLAADVFRPAKGELKELTATLFRQYEGLIFIMASGIVVRMIAPLITDKYHDPAVVTVDDACRFAISTLSGHEGGANDLTWKVASLLGAEAVITTASDTNRNIILGIGCRKETPRNDILDFVRSTLQEQGLSACDIRCAASVEIKKNETGLIEAFEELSIPLVFLPVETIKRSSLDEVTPSQTPMKHFGIPGVSEPCALLAGKNTRLIMKKKKNRGITIALAKETLR